MKNYYFYFVVLLLIISCENNQNYSAFYPTEIPIELRISEFNKKNLVKNYSFEQNLFDSTNSVVKYKIDNWEIIGDNVSIDYKNYSEGTSSVKIQRESIDIDEVNLKSDGIISDFIKVLPGNYNFFLDIKLLDVLPSVPRLNSKLGTDIDIHLEFFDKNKNKISSGIYFEYINKEIDNSFKGFSFSNFYEIENFDWGQVICRTLNYPFSEGDLPQNCEYIKIFIGSKAKGTIWVDNVIFEFSKWNFTSLESVNPFFSKKYHKTELIIPTPKIIKDTSTIHIKNKKIAILTNAKQTNADISALNLLKNKIIQFFKIEEKNIFINDVSVINDDFIVFEINSDNYEKKQNVKTYNQSYLISKKSNKIYLSGETEIGNYYAVTTLVQLFDSVNNTIHFAEIFDYPDFEGRSSKLIYFENEFDIMRDTSLNLTQKNEKIAKNEENLLKQPEIIEYLAFYKINKLYHNYDNLSKQWWKPGDFFNRLIKVAARKCNELGVITIAAQINPYLHFDYETQEELLTDSLRNIFSHSKTEDLQKIKDVLKIVLDNGGKTVMLCADDFVPHTGKSRGLYSLFTTIDKQQFYNIAQAQNYMINDIKKWIDINYSNIRFEVCPAPYLNQFIDYGKGSAEAFFRDFISHLDTSIAIIWTGNTVRSLSYDEVDIFRYSSLIKRKPMIWDNTPYARFLEGEYGGYPAHYPGKAVMCSLFEPFDVYFPTNFLLLIDSHYYSNEGATSELEKIKYATFADFCWNTKDYNPDFSLFKVLISQFGFQNALLLLKFNDEYYKLVSLWAEIRNGFENQSNNSKYNIDDKKTILINKIINNINNMYSEIEQNIYNKNLIFELKQIKDKKIEEIKNLQQKNNISEKKGNRQT